MSHLKKSKIVQKNGPIFLINDKINSKIILNFRFNGCAKYKDFQKDDKINFEISKITQIKKLNLKLKLKIN